MCFLSTNSFDYCMSLCFDLYKEVYHSIHGTLWSCFRILLYAISNKSYSLAYSITSSDLEITSDYYVHIVSRNIVL